MGKKTDEQIIEEARALFIYGDLAGASLKLMKIASKGNPEACYLISQVHLENADKRTKEKDREIYTKSAKIFLEKAVAARHKEAIALMENRFGGSNGEAKVDTQISNTLANTGNTSKRDAILEIIETLDAPFKLEAIKSDQTGTVEKFIRNHNLGISLSDVIAYCDTAVFSSGKKGHLLTEEFLYFSANGKRGTKVELSGLVSVEKLSYTKFQVIYTNGERKAYDYTEYTVNTEYYINLINALVALENKTEEKTESKEQVPVDIEEAVMLMNAGQPEEAISILEKYAREGNLTAVYYLACATAETGKYSTALKYANLVKDGNADDELKQNANELIEEIQAKIEQEKKEKAEAVAKAKAEELKHLEEENAKAEAAAKAKAEELKRLEEENAKAEAAIAEFEKTAPDSMEKVLEEIHELENKIEDAFAEKLAELEAMKSAAGEKTDEPEEEIFEETESVAESSEDDGNAIAVKSMEEARIHLDTDNSEEAFKWFMKAAEQGDAKAQYNLALMYYDGEGIEENWEEGIKWLKSAAEQGHVQAQCMFGTRFFYGHEMEKNWEEGIKWLTLAAEQNLVEAQKWLGYIYSDKLIDIEKSIKWYLIAMKNGDEHAQSELSRVYMKKADFYYYGEGTQPDKKEASIWYKKSAEQGCGLAATKLAKMYEKGDGISKDKQEAQRLYVEAAQQKEGFATYKVAEMYYTGDGIIEDKRKALELYEYAAVKCNIKEACYELARLYEYGENVKMDKNKASKLYYEAYLSSDKKLEEAALNALESLAMQKSGEAACQLGKIYYESPNEKDYSKAFKMCKMAMENGCINSEAALMLSIMYDEGKGTAEDFAKKKYWSERGQELLFDEFARESGDELEALYYGSELIDVAKKGDAEAQYNLALMYEYGNGTKEDVKEAFVWYKKAAENGDVRAQVKVASRYYKGEKIDENYKEAFKWYKKAAEQGHIDAQVIMGLMYYSGDGTRKNIRESVKWFKKAAEQGDVDAQYVLGVMYDAGDVIPANKQEAIKWYKAAVKQGHKDARKRLNNIQK